MTNQKKQKKMTNISIIRSLCNYTLFLVKTKQWLTPFLVLNIYNSYTRWFLLYMNPHYSLTSGRDYDNIRHLSIKVQQLIICIWLLWDGQSMDSDW